MAPMRVEIQREDATADVGMVEDMDMAEDITGAIDLVESRCL